MQDRTLIAISLSVAALGMAVLLFAIIIYDLPLSTIPAALGSEEGTVLRLNATVRSVQHKGNITIIAIMQPATIDVTIFQDVNLTPGQCVIIQGRKSSFRNEPQLSATRVLLC